MNQNESTTTQELSGWRQKRGAITGLESRLGEVVRVILTELQESALDMFANADSFFGRAGQADENNRSTVFDPAREAKRHGNSIRNAFILTLENSIQSTWAIVETSNSAEGESNSLRFNSENLTIVSDGEMEAWVAWIRVVSNAETDCGVPLGRLTSTLNSISQCKAVDKVNNPLGIVSITRAFTQSVSESFENPKDQFCFLQLFEKSVVKNLGKIYSVALKHLEGSGVTILDWAKEEHAPRATPSRRAEDVEPNGPEYFEEEHHQVHRLHPSGRRSSAHREDNRQGLAEFADLQRYLCAAEQLQGLYIAGGSPDPQRTVVRKSYQSAQEPISVRHLVESLNKLKTKYMDKLVESDDAGHLSFPSLQSFLLSLPNDEVGFENAGKTEQDTLRLVSDLFENLLRNENLSLTSKALIARLQMPLLKVALLDKTVFSDSEHPGRKLLNRIAIDGIGWPNNRELLKKNKLYLAAQDLVEKLNEDFADDVIVFQLALDKWNVVVARKRSRTEGAERRLNESILGRAKLEAAKAIVHQLIKDKASGTMLPSVVIHFITNVWPNHLVLACINSGTSSDGWKSLCTTFDDLITICAAMSDSEVLPSVNLPDLIAQLGEGLETSISEDLGAAQALDDVMDALIEGNSTDLVEFPEDFAQSLDDTSEPPDAEAEVEEENGEAIDDTLLARLQQGTWIEIDRPGRDGPLRCRMVVYDDCTGCYLFTNHDGIKVSEKSQLEMSQGLTKGDIRIIHEDMFVERAMSELVDGLRSAAEDSTNETTV